ncbi:MAG TPA: ABC transporter ATP-binding protein [Candidatus Dormibacteraeota bacterium]|nr:ABC transporter ATP-binding protein [Candidatus Dormibacteraeota bacterium]
MLEIEGVNHVYESHGRKVEALRDVSLSIRDGEFISFVGPSGCGKTTLLRILDGLTEQTSGRIVFNGAELTGVSQEMGFVFQDISLLPWRNVRENVEIGLEARHMAAAERRARALEALRMVGLEDVAEVPPYQLSGGMQQRVGVARALAIHPKVLLMDEPFGHLDNFTRETLQIEVSKLWSKLGTTIVFVTHDVDEAIFLSNRIVLFKGKPGRLAKVVEVDLPHPRWEFNVRGHPKAIEMRESIIEFLGVRDEVLL